MSGKVCGITGTTSGVGREAARSPADWAFANFLHGITSRSTPCIRAMGKRIWDLSLTLSGLS